MERSGFQRKTAGIKSPAFVIDEAKVESNLKVLKKVKQDSGCKILLAQKAFSMFSLYPLISKYLDGVCSSGLFEAKLGREEFGKEVHTFAPAFREDQFDEISKYSDFIVFNSISQLKKFEKKSDGKKLGLRVDPGKSFSPFEMYDPSQSSRFGIAKLDSLPSGVSGLHFHALCEKGAEELEEVLESFEKRFGPVLNDIEWANFGGGHQITQDGYNVEKLIGIIKKFKKNHPNVKEVYLEPGEAVVLNAGYLITTVLDTGKEGFVIVDTSVESHLPDVMITRLEKRPYIPPVWESSAKGKYKYKFGGVSCAAGDVIAEYSFNKPLKAGDRLTFLDAAHYSMVKVTTFNGVGLADIWLLKKDGGLKQIRAFGFEDFKSRL